jgi:hypothetical protein
MDEFQKAVETLRTEVTTIAEDKLSKGEFKTKMEEVGKDIAELTKLRDEDAARKAVDLPRCEPNRDVAAKILAYGHQSLLSKKDKEGFRPPLMSCYRENPITRAVEPTPIVDEDVRSALAMCDEVYICDVLMEHCGPQKGKWNIAKAMSKDGGRELFMKHFPDLGQRFDRLTQALDEVQGKVSPQDTTSAGGALEWVPTGFTSDLLEITRMATPEANSVPTFQQPTKIYEYPLLAGSGTAYDRSEGAAVAAGEHITAKRSFTAKEPAVMMKFTGTLEEDSIVAIAPTVRSESVRALAEGLSMAYSNGDTGGAAHIDVDLQGTGGMEHMFNGFRQYALDNATKSNRSEVDGAGGKLTSIIIANAFAAMGKYGLNKSALVLFTHPVGAAHLLQDSNVITADKLGPGATILTGQLASVFGIPILPSHAMDNRADVCSANGKNETSTDALSTSLLVNRLRWLAGDRRQITFEQDKNIETNIIVMVTSLRLSLGTVEAVPAAPISTPVVVAIVNID